MKHLPINEDVNEFNKIRTEATNRSESSVKSVLKVESIIHGCVMSHLGAEQGEPMAKLLQFSAAANPISRK